MNLLTKIKKLILLSNVLPALLLGCGSGISQSNQNNDGANDLKRAIPLSLSPDPNNGPFFGVNVSGSAFKSSMSVRIDTEGVTFIVPEGCIESSAVTTVVAHTKDEWNNDAKIVTGQVTLTAVDGTKYTVESMPIFVELGSGNCANGFSNFGAEFSAFQAYSGKSSYWTGGFFQYYKYPNGAINGFTIIAKDMAKTHKALLQLGHIESNPTQLNYQMINRSIESQNLINTQPLRVCTDYQSWGTSIPGVNMTIGGVTIPNYNAMIDTGGGMTIIRDDANNTYTNELKAANVALNLCPKDFSFLANCQCFESGQVMSVSMNPNNSGVFNYQFTSTSVAADQKSSIAICPNSTFESQNSPNPYIFTQGVNLGFNFFNYSKSVGFNFNACAVSN